MSPRRFYRVVWSDFMRKVVIVVFLLAIFGLLQSRTYVDSQSTADAERVEHWHEDLRYFAASLRGTSIPGEKDRPGQKDFAKMYPHFDADLAALDSDLPKLPNGAILWRLAKILAGAHVGHNAIFPEDTQVLPMAFEALNDGLVVASASEEFKSAVGTRLLKVGNLDTESFLNAAAPYIAYETDGWRRLVTAFLMRNRALLELLNLVDDGKVQLTLEGPRGIVNMNVSFVSSQARLVSIQEAFALPVSLVDYHREQRYYWRKYLPDSKTLYVQYRQCADDPKLKFADFAAMTLAEIDESKPRRVVVDLRFNSGGNSRVLKPLTNALVARSKIIGTPFVLIGPFTFSSGVMAARELRDDAKARLVGNPTGGLLGGYGEVISRKLPHSQLRFQWTIKLFPKPEPIRPDIPVNLTAADLRAGRDPVLEAAIAEPR